jgi:hypothetical protein
MSQFGMQMPGGQVQRGPTLNVYTGLLAVAALAMFAAAVFVYIEGSRIAPDGMPFKTHAYDEGKNAYDIKLPQ